MTLYEYYIVFPDGEKQEINRSIPAGYLIDINGNPISVPLPTNKMIAYQVAGKRTLQECGIIRTFYILEQLTAEELLDYSY
ncbi:hypothetical protein [Treponema pedis]|uniref:hypothetical protein n=1 Tax=Treponema pedis TaxID=409322 RepID=UPI000412936F|nr:hypothetical protein [Treponema pedis]